MAKKSRRRQSDDRTVMLLQGLCGVLAVILVILLAVRFTVGRSGADAEKDGRGSVAAAGTETEETGAGPEETGAGPEKAEPEAAEGAEPEAAEGAESGAAESAEPGAAESAEAAESGVQETEPETSETVPESSETEPETSEPETSEPETTEPETTAVRKYTDLTGIPAGTEISAERLDFDDIGRYFTVHEIEEGDAVYERINGKSYRKNDNVKLSDLRYVLMPHYNFNGQLQVGEMICNKDSVDKIRGVFMELFEKKYQIEKMHLIDDYWTGNPDTSDSNSIDHNNTSCFCYRSATGSSNLSRHAYGRAVDINPQQNPYVSYSSGSPRWSHSNADDYIDRNTGLPHVITHEDDAFKVFTSYGFTWGGDWNSIKDYQHFELR